MRLNLSAFRIIQSYKILRGNARLSINLELMFGIPFSLLTFYNSLYMKSQGITDRQIGYIISIQYLSASIFALFGGTITDALGRKKTLLIFDLIAWPAATLLWLFSNNFWMFAAAAVINSTNQIVMVAWTCFLVEDASSQERVAAFNLTNLLSQCSGLVLPIGGLIVQHMGIVMGQRLILAFSTVILATRILIRDHYAVETSIGKQIMEDRKNYRTRPKNNLYIRSLKVMFKESAILTASLVNILCNVGFVVFSFTGKCLYFVPYLTEVLGLDKSHVSVVGTVASVMMLVVFAFVVPRISRFDSRLNVIGGVLAQIIAFIVLIIIPKGSYTLTILSTVIYFLGFGVVRTYMDSMFADAAEGKERAGIYSITNVFTSLSIAVTGSLTGFLYSTKPVLVPIMVIAILIIVLFLLVNSIMMSKNTANKERNTRRVVLYEN